MINIAQGRGYSSLFLGNLNKSLPLESNSYDAAFVLESLLMDMLAQKGFPS